jgi:alpha-L-arabinofuranosidase
MSYVAPAVKDKFETLSIELKNAILERNVEIYTIHDLINVLDAIVKEADEEEQKVTR